MRLRNLFMILLLCMTVGVLGTSCTGDDGAPGTQGERGEQGEQGEQGEKGDPGDPSDMEATYSFLATWGAEDGKVTCDHDIFTGMADFPGPAELNAISATGEDNLAADDDLNNPFAAVCSGSLFHDSAVVKADDYLTVVAGDTVAVTAGDTEFGRLLFVKTARTDLDPEITAPKPSADDIGPAIRMTVQKNFVGGDVVADLNNTGGTNEPLQRQFLYSNCNIAGDPAKIKGMWRGVNIVQTKQGFRAGATVDLTPTDANTTTLVVTTRKVCVKLDSLPGTVKCFIDVVSNDPMVKTSKTISLYDAGTPTTVKKLVDTDKSETAPDGTLSGTVTNTAQTLFGTGDLGADDVEQLCNLFGEGL